MTSQTLPKSERLSAKKLIDQLFSKNTHAFVAFGFRYSYFETANADVACAALFVSPKKKLKTSVQRNRRKRLLRELYRLNKEPLLQFLNQQGLKISLSINYIGTADLSFQIHQAAFQKSINKLILELQKNYPISIYTPN